MLVSLPQFSHYSRTSEPPFLAAAKRISCRRALYVYQASCTLVERDGTLTDSRDVTTVLDLVDRDVVIVYTLSGRVDALKPITAAIVVVAGRGHAST